MRRYMITLGISLILIMAGVTLTIYEFMDFDIVDDFNSKSLSKETVVYNFKTSNVVTNIDTSFTNKANIIYDDNIAPGNIKISVNYYDDIINIESQSIRNDYYNLVKIEADGTGDFETISEVFKLTIEGLKNQEIYNYAKALRPTVKVYINKADRDIVKIRK